LISGPFKNGLHAALDFAIVASLVGAAASWVRGGKYHYSEPDPIPSVPEPATAG
jgi:hypothetical protein